MLVVCRAFVLCVFLMGLVAWIKTIDWLIDRLLSAHTASKLYHSDFAFVSRKWFWWGCFASLCLLSPGATVPYAPLSYATAVTAAVDFFSAHCCLHWFRSISCTNDSPSSSWQLQPRAGSWAYAPLIQFFFILAIVVVHIFWLVNACFCCVSFVFFPYEAKILTWENVSEMTYSVAYSQYSHNSINQCWQLQCFLS